MSDNIIFHMDVNSAFLSWEAVYRMAHKGGQPALFDEVDYEKLENLDKTVDYSKVMID